MTVDELIDRLTEMPGYRPVHIPGGEVIDLSDTGITVRLAAEVGLP